MKVLLITTNYDGGAAIACRRQHQALLANGIDSNLLVLEKVNQPVEKNVFSVDEIITKKRGQLFFVIQKKINLLLNKLPVRFNPKAFINSPYSFFRIDKMELFQQSDIIHLHWVPKIISWKHLFADKKKHFVWTLHDMNPFTGGNHYLSDFDYSRYQRLLQKNIQKKIDYLNNCNLKVIAPSVWLTNEAKSSSVLKQFKITTIPNCLDTEVFKPKDKIVEKNKLQLPLEKKIILFVAENPNDKRKGVSLLLDALNKLKETNKVCLLIIGKKIEQKISTIEMKQLGVIKNESTLASIYNAADLFLIPSLEDNLPNTMVEALACGTPVLGFDVGGISDMVIPNQTGMLAPKGDVAALAEKIDYFISIKDTSMYSLNARKLIEEKCSQRVVAKQLINLYKEE